MALGFFERGSSPVDWCEPNYVVNSYIAEFFNTISNVLFFLVPPLTIHLFKDFSKHVTPGIHMIWGFLIIIGAGSVYFHSTLTMAGQLMDELSILWVLMTAFTILYPDKYLPMYFHKHRHQWYLLFSVLTVLTTYLCFIDPELNAWCLMSAFLPPAVMLVLLLRTCTDTKIYRLTTRCVVTAIVAITCWYLDRFYCDIWLNLKMPYLHSIFHILVFCCAYYAIVIFSFFTADYRVPHLKPLIYYWPNNNPTFEFLFVPYIHFNQLNLNADMTNRNVHATASNGTSNGVHMNGTNGIKQNGLKHNHKEDETTYKLA